MTSSADDRSARAFLARVDVRVEPSEGERKARWEATTARVLAVPGNEPRPGRMPGATGEGTELGSSPSRTNRWEGSPTWRDTGTLERARGRWPAANAAAVLLPALVSLAYRAGLFAPGSAKPGDFSEALVLWFGSTAFSFLILATIRATGRGDPSRLRETLIVGSGPLARAFRRDLARDRNRRFIGFVDSRDGVQHVPVGEPLIGSLEQLDAILMRTVVDEVIVALPIKSKYDEIQAVIRACERVGVECTHPAQLFQSTRARPRLESRESFPVVRMMMAPDDPRLVIKRACDFVGASLLAFVCLPLILAVGIAVKATSRGPVLFVQERYGYRKRRFKMYKFRTMAEDAEAHQPELEALNEASGHAFKIRRDPRLTSIGSFLRRWSLDELPQLLNVLKGDMSLVGPRPMSIRDVTRFSESWLMRRFSVRPGLTCLWQISGRSRLSFDEWMALDLAYIDGWSTRLDLWILLKTIPAVLKRSGAV